MTARRGKLAFGPDVLLDKQIITADTLTALLLMALASTMLTVPIVRPKLLAVLNTS